jgi:hypothetical protein
VYPAVTAYRLGLPGRRNAGSGVAMLTFVQGARAVTAACVCAVTFFGGRAINVAKLPMSAVIRAIGTGETRGFMKTY